MRTRPSIISKYGNVRLLIEGAHALSTYRSRRMANLSTTLPIPMLDRINELVHEGKVPSRSHVIREAVRNYLETFD